MKVIILCMAAFMAASVGLAVLYRRQRLKMKKLEAHYEQELIIKQNVIDTLNKEVNRLNRKITNSRRKDVLDDLNKQ